MGILQVCGLSIDCKKNLALLCAHARGAILELRLATDLPALKDSSKVECDIVHSIERQSSRH